MWSANSILVCALSLLGRDPRTLPPITLLEVRPIEVSPIAEAFVRDGTIHLVTSTPAFRAARLAEQECGEMHALRKIASIVVHEEWHVRHSADERGAYHAQLTALNSLGSGPDTSEYYGVVRSMNAVLAAKRRETVLVQR